MTRFPKFLLPALLAAAVAGASPAPEPAAQPQSQPPSQPLSQPQALTADQKLDAILAALKDHEHRTDAKFAAIERRLTALEAKPKAPLAAKAPPVVLAPPAPAVRVPATQEWQDLYVHLANGHGYAPSYLATLSTGQLQALHDAAHGGVRTGVVRGTGGPVAGLTYPAPAFVAAAPTPPTYSFRQTTSVCSGPGCAAQSAPSQPLFAPFGGRFRPFR